MKVFQKLIISFLVTSLSMEASGQINDSIFRHIVDSIDVIQPTTVKKNNIKGCAYIIRINDQNSFDNLDSLITRAIETGKKNIHIKIGKGTYKFKENHIARKNEDYPNLSICIEGCSGTVITSKVDDSYDETFFLSYSEMEMADGQIEVIDTVKKLCKIPFNKTLSLKDINNYKKVQVTQWFRAPIYNITQIDRTGIYFIAHDLKIGKVYGNTGYNVNYDLLYAGENPRFRLYNGNDENNYSASCFFNLVNGTYEGLEIKGITFKGSKSGGNLMDISDVVSRSIVIKDCVFEFIHGGVALFKHAGNVVFDRNTIANTNGNEIRFKNDCRNAYVTNNTFNNCGQRVNNTFCVTCEEADYYIAGNVFEDFGYGAIGVGVWHGYEKKHESKGIIENNEIYYSQQFFTNSKKNLLMDSGAIYAWSQNDNVIIRYNYIHDYSGAGNNRGVFCDDGANNLYIYANVILNVPNCYSIDSRRERDQHIGFRNNENNFIAYNVIDGPVCFMGYDLEERHIRKGPNYVVETRVQNPYTNKFEHLEMETIDMVINSCHSIKNAIKATQANQSNHRRKLIMSLSN